MNKIEEYIKLVKQYLEIEDKLNLIYKNMTIEEKQECDIKCEEELKKCDIKCEEELNETGLHLNKSN